jgi:2-(1,2-epoxy-1,2-dihydrophenyl)acetyl-CoA isomerase
MSYDTVLVSVDSGVATLTLNRPERLNALNDELGGDLFRALREMEGRSDVRSLVLTGSGRGFCAGGDVKDMLGQLEGGRPSGFFEGALAVFHEVVMTMRRLPKPIIAVVNGPAVGAGMNLALSADVVHASETALFSQAFVKLGLVPDCGGTFFLPRLVGPARAAEIMFTGDTIDAKQALELGIVSRVVPAEELMPGALALARRLAEGPTAAIGRCKALLQRSFESPLDELLQLERLAQIDCGHTADFNEGVRAYTEKRTPRFQGH